MSWGFSAFNPPSSYLPGGTGIPSSTAQPQPPLPPFAPAEPHIVATLAFPNLNRGNSSFHFSTLSAERSYHLFRRRQPGDAANVQAGAFIDCLRKRFIESDVLALQPGFRITTKTGKPALFQAILSIGLHAGYHLYSDGKERWSWNGTLPFDAIIHILDACGKMLSGWDTLSLSERIQFSIKILLDLYPQYNWGSKLPEIINLNGKVLRRVGGEGLCQPRAIALAIFTSLFDNACCPFMLDQIPVVYRLNCDANMDRFVTFQQSLGSLFGNWLKFYGYLTRAPEGLMLPRDPTKEYIQYKVTWDEIRMHTLQPAAAPSTDPQRPRAPMLVPPRILQAVHCFAQKDDERRASGNNVTPPQSDFYWDCVAIRRGELLPTPAALAYRLFYLAIKEAEQENAPKVGYVDEIYHLLGIACPPWHLVHHIEPNLIVRNPEHASQGDFCNINVETENGWLSAIRSIVETDIIVIEKMSSQILSSQAVRQYALAIQPQSVDMVYIRADMASEAGISRASRFRSVLGFAPRHAIILVGGRGHYDLVLDKNIPVLNFPSDKIPLTLSRALLNKLPADNAPLRDQPYGMIDTFLIPLTDTFDVGVGILGQLRSVYNDGTLQGPYSYSNAAAANSRIRAYENNGYWSFPFNPHIIEHLLFSVDPNDFIINAQRSVISEYWNDYLVTYPNKMDALLNVAASSARPMEGDAAIRTIWWWIYNEEKWLAFALSNAIALRLYPEFAQACRQWHHSMSDKTAMWLNLAIFDTMWAQRYHRPVKQITIPSYHFNPNMLYLIQYVVGKIQRGIYPYNNPEDIDLQMQNTLIATL